MFYHINSSSRPSCLRQNTRNVNPSLVDGYTQQECHNCEETLGFVCGFGNVAPHFAARHYLFTVHNECQGGHGNEVSDMVNL